MTVHLGLDTGGTYTDAVLVEPGRGVVAEAKALTTKHDLSIGLGEAIAAVLSGRQEDIDLVSLSTTLATNAIVEGQGSPICLLLLGYDPEGIERVGLRRALGADPIVFVSGGHTAIGDEQAPLDIEAVRAAVIEHSPRVAAFAVSGFFSVRNPAHEIAVRDLVRTTSNLPVTCGHELSSRLDAPRRALTAALNARLVPQLTQLIRAVGTLLRERGIEAPLMVVKGDGSLMDAEAALTRPVETILSGPAASVVGAHYLSGRGDVFVADMGGTTTDIALSHDGQPILNADGASVGGWRTMVEAVAIHTFGLGGDSEVHFDGLSGLRVGPRRVMPLSLLVHQYPGTLAVLRQQAERPAEPHDGQFVLRYWPLETGRGGLTEAQARLWELLANGPLPLVELVTGYAATGALNKLMERGLVIVADFTPSDASHVLGLQHSWSIEAARLGATLLVRRAPAGSAVAGVEPEELARQLREQVVRQSARALIAAALEGDGPRAMDTADTLGRRLIDQAVGPDGTSGILGIGLRLGRPIVAIGAPVESYYPEVARRLATELIVPPHAAVSNAVGAVAGGVVQKVAALITSPTEGMFRAHLPTGIRDFSDLEAAAALTVAEVRRLAQEAAERAGGADIVLRHERQDNIVRDLGSRDMFIETRITAVATGRPRLAKA